MSHHYQRAGDQGYDGVQGGYGAGQGGYGGGHAQESYGMKNLNEPTHGGQYHDEPSSQYPYTSSFSQSKKKRNKWLWIGIPVVAAAIIVGAVVGGVVGSRHSSSNNNSSNGSSSSGSGSVGNGNQAAGVGSTATGGNGAGDVYLAVSTNSLWMLPAYPTATATSGYIAPTAVSSAKAAWPTDPSPPSGTANPRNHPRIIAPQYKWDALQAGLVSEDPYLKYWNETIINNATSQMGLPVQNYTLDGGLSGSGLLDPAREIKLRIKNWAYAYRMTNNTQYAERIWTELYHASGNDSSSYFGNTTDNMQWNPAHFLDLAELTNAFGIAYDWLYDYWSTDRKNALMWSIISNGLNWGLAALDGTGEQAYSWWAAASIQGNWNCVCNGGMVVGALAILGDDPTGVAEKILSLAPKNAQAACMNAVYSDGTWSETANYWYFGTTGAAELISSLTTALGDDQGLIASAPQWNLTSLYHMYVQGSTSLFNYGDCGPNKYSTTANSLLLWSTIFNEPRYALYQRDQYDSSEPWSMFWYDPSFEGAWWDNLPLDNYFNNFEDEWASMRNQWTDLSKMNYIAMKSGLLQGHQTHGDIDTGDFVLDALGQRWAGELGSGQYLSDGYFSSEAQDSLRWLYYRTRTEGQNTILYKYLNQNVDANVTSNFGTTGEAQGPAPGYTPPTGSSAFFTTDMTNAYNGTSFVRGIRFVNNRQQMLLQDDISGADGDVMWRMHTNATVSMSNNNKTADLSLGGQSLTAQIVQGPSNAVFSTMQPVRFASDPPLPNGGQGLDADQPNPGVTVLVIDIPEGNSGNAFSLQVLFTPQGTGSDLSAYSPPNVPLTQWTETSHNN